MSTVAVIGAGEIGGATARALASRDRVRRVVLIDAAVHVAAGKALDIQQSGAVEGFHTKVTATADLSAAALADVCVVADRTGARSEEWRGEEGLAMLRRLLQYASRAPIVCAGPGSADLILAGVRELDVQRERLFGSAPEALASATRAMVALDRRCSPGEVSLAVLGAPPAGFVVPWSDVAVAGFALERLLNQADLARLEARCRQLWPPGPQTLGIAAAQTAEAAILSARRFVSVFMYLDGEFGVRRQVAAFPAFLTPSGIQDRHMPSLNTRERVQLQSVLKG